MGIDYGSVRIGVAMSDETQTIATGYSMILNNWNHFSELLKILTENHVQKIILGYPLNMKGLKTEQTLEVEKFEKEFGDYLMKNSGTPIELVKWDERLTSKMAERSMIVSGMKKKKRRDKSNIDIISAALILQSYLDSKK